MNIVRCTTTMSAIPHGALRRLLRCCARKNVVVARHKSYDSGLPPQGRVNVDLNLGPFGRLNSKYPFPGRVGLHPSSAFAAEAEKTVQKNVQKLITIWPLSSFGSLIHAIKQDVAQWRCEFQRIQLLLSLYTVNDKRMFYPHHPNYICIEISSSVYTRRRRESSWESTASFGMNPSEMHFERPADVFRAAKLAILIRQALQRAGFASILKVANIHSDPNASPTAAQGHSPTLHNTESFEMLFELEEGLMDATETQHEVGLAEDTCDDMRTTADEKLHDKKSIDKSLWMRNRRIILRVITSAPIGRLSLDISKL